MIWFYYAQLQKKASLKHNNEWAMDVVVVMVYQTNQFCNDECDVSCSPIIYPQKSHHTSPTQTDVNLKVKPVLNFYFTFLASAQDKLLENVLNFGEKRLQDAKVRSLK